MNDELARDGRRTAAALLAVGAIVVTALMAMFWLLNGATALSLNPSVVRATVTGTPTTTPELTATSATTTFVPPTPGWVTPSETPRIAPAELPTMTAPVPGQTADSPPAAPAPAPAVSNVQLTCKADGKKATSKLTFTTTTTVDVTLAAGDAVDRKSVGPGAVTMSNSGKGNACAAVVDGQPVGPVAAS